MLPFFKYFYKLIIYLIKNTHMCAQNKKRKHNRGFSVRDGVIRLTLCRKTRRVVQENKEQRGVASLLGTIIIHHWQDFVNIHFVRFFVDFFGEKYST